MLNLPWTKGTLSLLFLFNDNSVSGIIRGVCPSPQSAIVRHGFPLFGFHPVAERVICRAISLLFSIVHFDTNPAVEVSGFPSKNCATACRILKGADTPSGSIPLVRHSFMSVVKWLYLVFSILGQVTFLFYIFFFFTFSCKYVISSEAGCPNGPEHSG